MYPATTWGPKGHSYHKAALGTFCLLEALLRELYKTSAHTGEPEQAYQDQEFSLPLFYILKQVYSRRGFSRLLSHPSDRFECSPTSPFLVSELTEQTLLLTKHWTKRRKVISLPNLDGGDRQSLSFLITAMRGGTKSLFLAVEFSGESPELSWSHYALITKFNDILKF